MLSVIKDLAPILDTLTANEGTFKPIFDGIQPSPPRPTVRSAAPT